MPGRTKQKIKAIYFAAKFERSLKDKTEIENIIEKEIWNDRPKKAAEIKNLTKRSGKSVC